MAKTNTYEVIVYRPAQVNGKTVEIEAGSFNVLEDGVARFWADDNLVAAFHAERWESVVKK